MAQPAARFLPRFDERTSNDEWKKHCIYKVPPWRRELNREAYEPRVVSIGPYHHGKPHLASMEEHKHRALRHFRERLRTQTTVEELVNRFKKGNMMMEVRGSYADPLEDDKWNQDDMLASLFVLDGCFLLELLLTHESWEEDDPIFRKRRHTSVNVVVQEPNACEGEGVPQGSKACEGEGDMRRHGVVQYIKADLLGIENQIPLSVLHKLAEIANLRVNVDDLVRYFYGGLRYDQTDVGLHILDVYRRSCLISGDQLHPGWTTPFGARELSYHGIDFNSSRSMAFNDVSFSFTEALDMKRLVRLLPRCNKNFPGDLIKFVFALFLELKFLLFSLLGIRIGGELSLPVLEVGEMTEAVLLNLMAFEAMHLRGSFGMETTRYVLLMSKVASREEDVRLLKGHGILRCVPEKEDGEVIKMFGRLTRGFVLDFPHVSNPNVEMLKLCHSNWFRAAWRRAYRSEDGFRAWLTLTLGIYAVFITILGYYRTDRYYDWMMKKKCAA